MEPEQSRTKDHRMGSLILAFWIGAFVLILIAFFVWTENPPEVVAHRMFLLVLLLSFGLGIGSWGWWRLREGRYRVRIFEQQLARAALEQKSLAELRTSEEKFRALADYAPDWVFWVDPNGRFLYVSPACEKICGYRPDEFCSDPGLMERIIHPDDLVVWRGHIRPGVDPDPDEAISDPVSFRIRNRQGFERWIEHIHTLVFDGRGNFRGYRGVNRDVTRRKKNEDALRLAQGRFQRLVDANIVGIVIADGKGELVLANDYFLGILGRTRTEFEAGLHWADMTPPEWWSADAQAVTELYDRGVCTPYEKEFQRKDGSRVMVLLAQALLPGDEQQMIAVCLDITERNRNEELLRLQASRARSLLELPKAAEQADETAFIQQSLTLAEDLTGSEISFMHFVNDDEESIELTAWSEKTLTRYCNAAFDKHYPVSQAGVWAEALRRKTPVMFNNYASAPERRGLPDGHAELRRLVVVPVIEQGRVVMLAGVGNKFADYTEVDVESLHLIANETWHIVQRSRTGAALRKREKIYSAIVTQAGDGVVLVDVESMQFVEFNDTACKSLGYGREEFGRLSLPDIQSEMDVSGVREKIAEILATEGMNFDTLHRRKDGSVCNVRSSSRVVHIGDKTYLAMIWIDISERIRVEEQLRKFSLVVEQSPTSIVITGLDANIEYINEAFLEVTGYAWEEVVGRNPRFLKSGKTPMTTYEEMWDALTHGRIWKGKLYNKRKNGEEFVELVHVAPIRQADDRITHYLGIKEDVTEKERIGAELDQYRHHLEELVNERTEQLAEARDRAEAATRAKSTFLANMSHEIRTPMNAILGMTHLIKLGGVGDTQLAQLEKIETSGRHLLGLINDILDLSKIDAGKLLLDRAPLSVASIQDNVVSMLSTQAVAKGLDLVVDTDPLPKSLMGDSVRLTQALVNLIGNAIKFTSRGSVTLRTRVLEEGPAGVRLRFEVEDTGIGIQPDILAKLFIPFEQADVATTRKYGGTGLGLAITKHLAELMDGEIGADSTLGMGSRFWITARLAKSGGDGSIPAAVKAVDDAGAVLERDYGGVRLLVAEDDPTNQEVALGLLRSVGLAPELAGNGAEAVGQVRKRDFDLVLMDMQMPVMDGLEATQQIRKLPNGRKLPILAMTANAFAEDRQRCLDAGMNDFIAKPIDPDSLFSTLLKWLPARPASPALARPAPSSHPADADDPALRARLATIDGLQLSQGLRALANDVPAFLRLLRRFARDHRHDMAHLSDAVAEGEIETARRFAHTLKGAAATLGLVRIQAAAEALEAMFRLDKVDSGMEPLRDSLHRELDALSSQLESLPVPDEPKWDTQADTGSLKALLDRLENLLIADDTSANDLMRASRKQLEQLESQLSGRLGQQIENFDYQGALSTLGRLRAEMEGDGL